MYNLAVFEYDIENKEIIHKINMRMSRSLNSIAIQDNPNNISEYCFVAEYNLNKLHQISKYFRIFETIEEIYIFIKNKFINNDVCLKIEPNSKLTENSKIILSLEFISISKNEAETATLELFPKILDLKSKIKLLYKKVDDIHIRNLNAKKEIENLSEKIFNLEYAISEFNLMNNSQKNANYTTREKNINISSKIITKKNKFDFLIKRFKLYQNSSINEDGELKCKLLYRASKDGDAANIFHSKCDFIKHTLVIIETGKGFKFGGYANEQTWDGNKIYKKDNKAFIFSFDKNKIYNVKNDRYAIGVKTNFGPIFGNDHFYINDKAFINGGICKHGRFCCFDDQVSDQELTNGDKNFKLVEMEVFEVLFE